jgi:hypothetical protein
MTAEGHRAMPVNVGMPAAPHRPLSLVIAEFSQTVGQRVTVEELVTALSDRSFAALIMLFAAPNLLPLPPGSSTVFGIPLVLIASQLLTGRSRLWLPRWLRQRSLDGQTFRLIAAGIEPFLRRLEKLAKPRYWPMSRVAAERFVGLVVLLMALILIFPIPFGNWTPAVAALLVSLGLSERDGLWLGCGALVAAGSVGLAAGIVGTIGFAANGILQ